MLWRSCKSPPAAAAKAICTVTTEFAAEILSFFLDKVERALNTSCYHSISPTFIKLKQAHPQFLGQRPQATTLSLGTQPQDLPKALIGTVCG